MPVSKTSENALMLSLLLFILSSPSFALSAAASGECRDFEIRVQEKVSGCWDAKIDAPAQVLHQDGWKDSFYFVSNALCEPKDDTTIKIRLSTQSDVNAVIKLRQNSTVIQQPLEIRQNCPAPASDSLALLAAILFAAILITAVWKMRNGRA